MTSTIEPHFDGDTFKPDPTQPLRLEIVIDNNQRNDYPDNPWTLNVSINNSREREELLPLGESGLVDGTIVKQLRDLADAIESGEVKR